MVHICDCIPARIRHALAELAETLDETYERNLRGINKAIRGRVTKCGGWDEATI